MDTPRTVTIAAVPLTAAGWEPFGWIPVADTDPLDGAHHLAFAWGDPHLNVIAHAYDEIEHAGSDASCVTLYRHDTHTQALMPLNCAAIVAVAPAHVDFSDPAHLDTLRAFRLEPQDVIVLAPGTWHWGPYPVAPGTVRLLNVQGRRYAEDNTSVSLPDAQHVAVAVRSA